MKRPMIAFACVFLAGSASAQTAVEKAEKRIAELVTPGNTAAPWTTATPMAWKASRIIETFDVPIKPAQAQAVRLEQAPLKGVKPRPVTEPMPLAGFQDKSKVPQAIELPTKPLIWLPSVDVHAPVPIPILAQPAKDRAALTDPAFEASVSAAMKPFAPARDRPVPFTPYNLPEPFEHSRYGQLRNPPEESATPPVIPIQRPK